MHSFNAVGLIALCMVHSIYAGPLDLGPLVSTVSGLVTNPDDIKFYLFKDPKNMDSYTEIEFGNRSSLQSSGYLSEIDSATFVVHGFLSTAFNLPYPRNVINAYLRNGPSSNYIAVDWSKLSTPVLDDSLVYPIVAANTIVVGKRIGEFIRFLMKNMALSSPSKVHMVGHSLGSHVSARTGQYMRTNNLPMLGRITGLDPAGPGFQFLPEENRLGKEDATFVDTIHTSLTLGYIGNVGHVSFYPNHGGPFQPNCDHVVDPVHLLGICSHNKVGEYFAYSILNKTITGCKCSGGPLGSCYPDCDDTAVFGEYTPFTTRGTYFLLLTTTPRDLE